MSHSYYASQARAMNHFAIRQVKLGFTMQAKSMRALRDQYMATARRYQGV